MRISKIVCDGCGKEITGDPIKLFAERVDRETGDFTTKGSAALYAPDKDFCDECFNSIKNFIDKVIVGVVEEPKLTEDPAPVVEEPAPAELPKPVMEESKTEKTEQKTEEPKQLPKAKLGKQPTLPKAPQPPSIRDLVRQGKSKEEVCRITGCKPLTYDQTLYQLRKKGLMPPPNKTVKCSEVHDSCAYGTKVSGTDTCDYIGITGKMRGCPAEECNRYMKKGEM